MRKIAVFVALAFLLTLCAIPVHANDIPPLPHAFYGDLIINGSPAPAGTTVEARGEGVRIGIEGNPIVTTQVGRYGSSNPLEDKLIVQGDIAEGATITFYVNGVSTGQTATWHSGEVTKLDLSVTMPVARPPVAPPGVGAAPAAFSLSNLSVKPAEVQPKEAVTITVSVANTGGTQGSYTVVLKINGVKEAEKRVTIAAGKSQTVSFSVSKEDVGSYSVVVDGLSGSFTVIVPPPAPPVPALAEFSLSNLSIQPTEVEPREAVTIAVSVANTGGTEGSYTVVLMIDGVKEAEKRVTIAAGRSETVSFTVSKEEAGSYSVVVNGLSGSFSVIKPVPAPVPTPAPAPAPAPAPPVKAPIDWPLVGGIIAAVIIAGLLIYFLVVRRRAY